MSATLQYPITSPTTTITFDAITRISRQRQVTKVFEQGDLDGNSVIESAGAALLKLTVSFELRTDASKSALQKWDDLDTLIQQNNEYTMRFTIAYETELGSKSQYYDGKITGVTCDDVVGDPDLITGTLKMTIESKGAIS